MAWSDAARAAAREARRRHSKNLHTEIVRGIGGPNKALTIAALRSNVARSMIKNRKALASLPAAHRNPVMYMAAQAQAKLVKSNMVRGMQKFHSMYSKGSSPKKMGFKVDKDGKLV